MNEIDFKIYNEINKLYDNKNMEQLDNYLKNNCSMFSDELFLSFFRDNNVDLIERSLKYNKRKLPNYLINDSISCQNLKYVKLLIPHTDLKENFFSPLRAAASENYCEALELLIPLSDPKNNRSFALYEACFYGAFDAVKMLMPHSNLKFVLNDLKKETNTIYKNNIEKSIEIIHDYLLKEKLNKELNNDLVTSKNKIKRKI